MNAAITGAVAATILAATVAASLAIAFALEWMCLRGVMALMPARQASSRQPSPRIGGQTKLTRTQLTRSFALGQKH